MVSLNSSAEKRAQRAAANKPKRQSVVRKDSAVVQGKGSFVQWRKLTWGESKEVMTEREALKDNPIALAEKMQSIIIDHVDDWNWVDDDGEPLPLPKNEPEGFDELNEDEITFLASLLNTDIDPKA